MTVTYAIKIRWKRYEGAFQKSSLLEERYDNIPQAEKAIKTLKKSPKFFYEVVRIPVLSETEIKIWRDYCYA